MSVGVHVFLLFVFVTGVSACTSILTKDLAPGEPREGWTTEPSRSRTMGLPMIRQPMASRVMLQCRTLAVRSCSDAMYHPMTRSHSRELVTFSKEAISPPR